MSPLEWALVLQAVYYFCFINLVRSNDGSSFWESDIAQLDGHHHLEILVLSILGIFPSHILFFTVLSLLLHPTPWVFIWLLEHSVTCLVVGIEKQDSTWIIIPSIGFVVLLINLKLAVNLTPTIAALMIFSSVIAILLLLYCIFERFLPKIDPPSTPENIIYLTVFLEMMSVAFWFFFEPMSATILGFAAAAGVCLLYLRSEITN
jgi:hypothetical protein